MSHAELQVTVSNILLYFCSLRYVQLPFTVAEELKFFDNGSVHPIIWECIWQTKTRDTNKIFFHWIVVNERFIFLKSNRFWLKANKHGFRFARSAQSERVQREIVLYAFIYFAFSGLLMQLVIWYFWFQLFFCNIVDERKITVKVNFSISFLEVLAIRRKLAWATQSLSQ
jgi:hypothetical protein